MPHLLQSGVLPLPQWPAATYNGVHHLRQTRLDLLQFLPPAVGCIMGCTFCATGTMGIKGDLTAGEIIEQLVHARAVSPIRNIGELSSQRLADLDSRPGMCAAVSNERMCHVPHCKISESVGCACVESLAKRVGPGLLLAWLHCLLGACTTCSALRGCLTVHGGCKVAALLHPLFWIDG